MQIDTTAPVESQRRLTTRADEEIAAQDEDARIVVFFLDDYHVRLGNSMASRKHLADFVTTQLGPSDLVAVMYPLSPLDSVTLTRDHDQLVRALERFQGRKFDYTPRNALEDRYANYPTEIVERVRRQVSLSALQGLSVKLGALREGRKAIVLVSEGYVAMLPPQMRGSIATMPGVGNPARNNPFAGENNMAEDRAKFMGELDVQSELQRVFDAANRSNTAIYAVDPRGLSTGEFDIQDNIGMRTSQDSLRQTQNTLRTLADETDGRAIVNRNDLAKGMQQLVRDSSAYYLIGYNSTQSPSDGKFHEIRVRVKRPGTQVRARKGYWALTADRDGAGHRAAQAGAAAGGRQVAGRHLGWPRPAPRPHLGRHRARRAAARPMSPSCGRRFHRRRAAAARRWGASCSPRSTPRASRCSAVRSGEAPEGARAARRRDHDRGAAGQAHAAAVDRRPARRRARQRGSDDRGPRLHRAQGPADDAAGLRRPQRPRVPDDQERSGRPADGDARVPPHRAAAAAPRRRGPRRQRRRDLHRAAAQPPGRQDGRPAGDAWRPAPRAARSTSRWPTCRPASS